jgi:hypothetical protein
MIILVYKCNQMKTLTINYENNVTNFGEKMQLKSSFRKDYDHLWKRHKYNQNLKSIISTSKENLKIKI